jgi:hypothetical protein
MKLFYILCIIAMINSFQSSNRGLNILTEAIFTPLSEEGEAIKETCRLEAIDTNSIKLSFDSNGLDKFLKNSLLKNYFSGLPQIQKKGLIEVTFKNITWEKSEGNFITFNVEKKEDKATNKSIKRKNDAQELKSKNEVLRVVESRQVNTNQYSTASKPPPVKTLPTSKYFLYQVELKLNEIPQSLDLDSLSTPITSDETPETMPITTPDSEFIATTQPDFNLLILSPENEPAIPDNNITKTDENAPFIYNTSPGSEFSKNDTYNTPSDPAFPVAKILINPTTDQQIFRRRSKNILNEKVLERSSSQLLTPTTYAPPSRNGKIKRKTTSPQFLNPVLTTTTSNSLIPTKKTEIKSESLPPKTNVSPNTTGKSFLKKPPTITERGEKALIKGKN